MRFGSTPVAAAVGGIVAHAVGVDGRLLKKGHVVTPADVAALEAAGVRDIVVAHIEAEDCHEDEAARRLADRLVGPTVRRDPAATGRANLFAEVAGLLEINADAIHRLNLIDPGITVATLPPLSAVEAGRMIATVKIIPFAVPTAAVEAAARIANEQLLTVRPFRPHKVAVISTLLPTLKPTVVDKTLRVLAERLAPSGSSIALDRRCLHDTVRVAGEIAAAVRGGADLVVVFGASAVVDRGDVVPSAIEAAGGEIIHVGMPVDPGNLLVIGQLDGVWVLGAPGCARSPKENGFDWVLARLLAGLAVTPEDIMGMGVGGLLMEIVSRPQPREAVHRTLPEGAGPVAALVLAAGRSSRTGGPNKLLATLDGKPLVRHVVEAALASAVSGVTVVTGHMADRIEAALTGLPVRFVHNPDYAAGLSTSLKTGIAALPETAAATIVLLADMPRVEAEAINALVAAFDPDRGTHVVVPTFEGRRGNPVLWSRRFFEALAAIQGDVGARHLIGENAAVVTEVELGPAVALDLDTREALSAAGAVIVE